MSRYDPDPWRKSSSPLKFRSGYTSVHSSFTQDLYSSPFPDSPSKVPASPILADMQRAYENSLTKAYDRLQYSSSSHDNDVQSLQRLVNSLREEVASTAQANSKELSDLRAQFQARLIAENRLRDTSMDVASTRLSEMQQIWASESDRSVSLRQELLTVRVKSGEEASKLRAENTALALELDRVKGTVVTRVQGEVDRTRGDVTVQQDEHIRFCSVLKQENQTAINEVRNKLAMQEARARNGENEVSALRQQLLAKTQQAESDVKGLNENLKSLKTVVEGQEAELIRLKEDREMAKRDAKELNEEVVRLEREMHRVHESNSELRSSSEKLERLVYGRNGKRSLSPEKKR